MTARKIRPRHESVPEYNSMLRGIEAAMRKLPLLNALDADSHICSLAEKYADLRHGHHWADTLMTTKQIETLFSDAREQSEALLKSLNGLNYDAKHALNTFRATSLDRLGIATPSIDELRISLQWLCEAAQNAPPPTVEKHGPDKKTDARKIADFAAEDFYRLTGEIPTTAVRVNKDGFRDFLGEILDALGMTSDSVETLSKDAVKTWKLSA